MKKLFVQLLVSAVFVCLFSLAANAQVQKVSIQSLKITKDVTFFVVGQSAKLTGQAARAAAPIALRAAQKTTVFTLKQTKNVVIKAVLPLSRELIVKYLKYRLMP
jgi:hypothetical protein